MSKETHLSSKFYLSTVSPASLVRRLEPRRVGQEGPRPTGVRSAVNEGACTKKFAEKDDFYVGTALVKPQDLTWDLLSSL